jgi:hypothetical protein
MLFYALPLLGAARDGMGHKGENGMGKPADWFITYALQNKPSRGREKFEWKYIK